MKAITVSQLNNYIKQIFEAEELLHNIQVIGEIDGISARGSAVYFSIKDEGATIPCVCYQPAKLSSIKNGQSVTVRGTVGYWHKAGKINFTVYHVEVFGFGQLFLKFQELKAKLEKEGFFEAGRKKALPQNPRRIGVVTSKQGAVFHDIVKVAHRRNSGVDIVLYPVQVQGAGAENSIAQGVEYFNITKSPVDVIIVARGGGSAEDLNAFNSEVVARSVFASKIPVVSAVGHETDWTLIDFVTDLRAPTPSAAAELVVTETLGQRERVIQTWKMCKYILNQKLRDNRKRVEINWDKVRDLTLANINQTRTNTIADYNLTRNSVVLCLEKSESKIREIGAVVESYNPMAILRRGYGRVFGKDGEITSVKNLSKGELLDIKMKDGTINAEIKRVGK